MPPALKAQHLNHWTTREVQVSLILIPLFSDKHHDLSKALNLVFIETSHVTYN